MEAEIGLARIRLAGILVQASYAGIRRATYASRQGHSRRATNRTIWFMTSEEA
jgi:hypothetical protein